MRSQWSFLDEWYKDYVLILTEAVNWMISELYFQENNLIGRSCVNHYWGNNISVPLIITVLNF